ncbi:MAG TPA: indolepyruvate oxidoreductase subunit beta family protein, partial [Gammaproteobacteria bacterium]|nr:indolepyruvate oxidoreductase subunit beta family protein [Gammaproteobacteria bacterium]
MDTTPAIIKLAIFAVGGQGGGVLSNWIVGVAERNGYRVQATSIAGVAQRTGATVYYIEMAADTGRPPVFALAPSAGDVDILIAAEMMESGRAMVRGLVSPERTTLITSTHRILAMSEKTVPGNGIADGAPVLAAGRARARRYIAFDMEQIAVAAGSVISASLFGALAASAVLPFARESFEAAVRASGRSVDSSLRAFDGAFTAVTEESEPVEPSDTRVATTPHAPTGSASQKQAWQELQQRLIQLPAVVREMAQAGCRKVADFQDIAYANEYLDRLDG